MKKMLSPLGSKLLAAVAAASIIAGCTDEGVKTAVPVKEVNADCSAGAAFDKNGWLCTTHMTGPGNYTRNLDRGAVPEPVIVSYAGPYPVGDTVIDQKNRYLYLILSNNTAKRYTAGMGRAGRLMPQGEYYVYGTYDNPTFKAANGVKNVFAKADDSNPLGRAAVMFLPVGQTQVDPKVPEFFAHGTNRPDLLENGQFAISDGCTRMVDPDAINYKNSVRVGSGAHAFRDSTPEKYFGTQPVVAAVSTAQHTSIALR